MNLPHCPLRFRPIYKDYLWGGERIASRYNRGGSPTPCAESWELAAHPSGDCVLANTALAGETLSALCKRFGAALTGSKAPNPREFPLLIKIIDARDRLSVQVHPSVGAETKNEAWYVLSAAPITSFLFGGFAKGVGASELDGALSRGDPARIEALLARHEAREGETLLINAGCIHAIGAGCLIYEVQQSSDTTYRFYDWDRRDANGKPRQLHVEQARAAINLALPPIAPTPPQLAADGSETCVATPWFTLRRRVLSAPAQLLQDGTTFHSIFVERGALRLAVGGATLELATGDTALIPAELPRCDMIPQGGDAALLLTSL